MKEIQNQNGVADYLLAIERLQEVFTEQGWSSSQDEEKIVFDNFCIMMEGLSSDERKLILTLTSDFLYLENNRFNRALYRVGELLALAAPSSIEEIFVLPLIKPEDEGKVKSGATMIYFLRHIVGTFADTRGIEPFPYDRSSSLSLDKHKNRKNALILFIDDFIGSSETALSAINHYKDKKYDVPSDTVLVIALAGQEQAIKTLADAGIRCVCAYERKRGISDSDLLANKEFAFEVMDQIEGRIGVNVFYQRGYRQSEALFAMPMRSCPDNTFPVFWVEKVDEKKVWTPPFQR